MGVIGKRRKDRVGASRRRGRATRPLQAPTHALISPVGLSLLGVIPLLLSLLIPARTYSSIVKEPWLMGGIILPAFFIGCVACHIAGAILVRSWCDARNAARPSQPATISPHNSWMVVMVPLAAIALLNIASLAVIVHNTPGLVGLIVTGRWDMAKGHLNTEGAFTQAQPLLVATCWWGYYRFAAVKDAMTLLQRQTGWLILIFAVVVSFIGSCLKVARYEAIPLIIGLALIATFRSKRRFGPATIVRGAGMVAVLGAMFTAFSYLRGFKTGASSLKALMGYGPAAFNHLAALLEGRLVFPYQHSGAYVLAFISYIPLLHRVVDTQALLGLPDLQVAFLSEFVATAAAGLNGEFIWVTAFGYYFTDLSWFVFPFLFLLGGFAAWAWDGFRRGSTIPLVLYPHIATSILLWFTATILTAPTIITVLGVGLALAAWEKAIGWIGRPIRSTTISAREDRRIRRAAMARHYRRKAGKFDQA